MNAPSSCTVSDQRIRIEVAYAGVHEQALLALRVPAGCKVGDAIAASGILQRFPEIDLRAHKVGIFGRRVTVDHVLEEGDRVEIYRPLRADPKQVRRELARLGRTMRRRSD